MATRELKVNIVGDSKDLERALGSASKSSHSLGSSFLSLAKYAAVAGAALGAVAVVGIKKSIDAASDLEEQINKTNVVFAGNQKEVIKWSQGLEKSFGLSSRAALEAAGTYGNMLVPMGFARKEASKMSEKMVELAGDMASFNNASPEDTLKAIQAGLAGQARPLRQYGVFLSAARVEQEALTETGKKSAKQLTEQEKAVARYNLILKDTKDTQGDFARSAGESLANQMRILKAQFEDSAAAIGTALLPAVIKLMGLIGQVVPVIADFAVKLSQAVGPHITDMVNQLKPGFESLKQTIIGLWQSVQQLLPTIQRLTTISLQVTMSSWGQAAIAAGVSMYGFQRAAVAVTAALERMAAANVAAAITGLLNPLNLATAAVGFLVAGFILARNSAINASGELGNLRDAILGVRDAALATASSQDRLRDAHIGVKTAAREVSKAIEERNRLDAEGKKGTDAYKDAQLRVQQAYSARIRSEHELNAAQAGVTDQTKKNADAVANLSAKGQQLTNTAHKVASGLAEMGAQYQKHTVVTHYANAMEKTAKQADEVAKTAQKSNPQLAEAARQYAANARAAANYAKRTGEIPDSLAKVIGPAQAAGQRVGAAFGQGLSAGIGGQIANIRAQAARAITEATAAARAAAQAKSPSKTWQKLGEDMQQGLIIGFITKGTAFSQAAAAHMSTALNAARAEFIVASKVLGADGAKEIVNGFRSQQQSLAQQIKSALHDAMVQALADAKQAVLDAKSEFASAFSALAEAAMAAFDATTQAHLTKTEKKIAAQDESRAAAQRKKALDDANQAIQDANASMTAAVQLTQNQGESPEDFAARQAAAVKSAADAFTSATQQQNDALFAIQRAADEKTAAQERKAYEASRERRKVSFKNQMDDLEKHFLNHEISSKEFLKRLTALFEKFDVPLANAGKALGAALADGISTAFATVKADALTFIEALAREFRKSKLVLTVDIQSSGGTTKRQHGGPVSKGSPYIVGEAGPELFIPASSGRISPNVAMSGGGGAMAEITVPVYLDSAKITEVVRREMLRFQKRNGTSAV